jgi:hypothetical protein
MILLEEELRIIFSAGRAMKQWIKTPTTSW